MMVVRSMVSVLGATKAASRSSVAVRIVTMFQFIGSPDRFA